MTDRKEPTLGKKTHVAAKPRKAHIPRGFGNEPLDGNAYALTENGYVLVPLPDHFDEDDAFFDQFDEFGFLKDGYLR